jgi:adenine-specific DNA-methyltransferase
MPTLNWIGKEAVVKHQEEVPFRLLEPVPELSCGAADSGNLIVQGDNLHTLGALLPKFDGPKVIYAAANRMGGRAAREGITFKQTPYALGV